MSAREQPEQSTLRDVQGVPSAGASRKVVINACFGGFSLSPAGQAAYLARQGKQAFFYVEDRDSAERPGERDYVLVGEPIACAAFMFTTFTENIGERVGHETIWPDGNAHPSYWSDRDLKRDDADLIAVVEEDAPKASGRFAALDVVEIPDDVDWTIEEYDGFEHVAEAHRVWP